MDAPPNDGLIVGLPFSVSIEWDERGDLVSDPPASALWWGQLTGQPAGELTDWRWLQVIHPEDRESTRQAWERAISRGESYIAAYRVRTADGEWHVISAHGVPRRAEDGAVIGWTGSLIDITAYRQATEQAASISALISALGKTSTTEEIARAVLDACKSTLNADAGGLTLLSGDRQTLIVVGLFGDDSVLAEQYRSIPLAGPYPSALAVSTGQPVWIESLAGFRDLFPESADVFENAGFRSVAALPLSEQGDILGTLSVIFCHDRSFSAGDRGFLESVAMQTARAVQLTRLIDAEREARESLEFTHKYLRQVTNVVPALVGYIDADYRYQFTNAAYHRWFNLDQDIVPGTPLIENIGQASFDDLLPRFQQALSGEIVEFETVQEYRGLGQRTVAAVYSPDFADDGTVRGFAVLATDITERKRAEVRSARLLDFTTSLAQATTQDDVVADVVHFGGVAIGATASACFLVEDGEPVLWRAGASWPELIGAMSLPVTDPVMLQVVRDSRVLALQPGDPLRAESALFDGMARQADAVPVVVAPIRGAGLTRGGVAFALDPAVEAIETDASFAALLADLAAAALDRAELHDSLREREARFRNLAEALPQIVWVSSGDGARLEYLNKRWLEYTGLREGETVSGRTSELVHEEDRLREQELWREALRTGTLFEAEVRLRRHDGVYHWFLSRGVPLRDQRGQVVSWFGTMTDIDEQQRSAMHTRFVSDLDSRIRLMDDPQQIMEALVSTVGEHLPVQRCLLTESTPDPASHVVPIRPYDIELPNRRIELRACWESSEPPRCAELGPLWTRVESHVADELRRGRIVHVDDVASDSGFEELRAELQSFGVGSFVIVPFLRAGRWVASLAVHTTGARSWTSDEMTIADAALNRSWPVVERSRAVEAMRQSENRLRHAAQAADFGSFDFETATGRGYWANDVLRVFRKPPGTAAPEQLSAFLDMIHPEDRRLVEIAIDEASNPDGDGDLHVEFRHLTGTGEVCWVLLRGNVEFTGLGDDRRAYRISGIVMDITKRKQDEEERVAFIDAAAHDLKNPVAAIRALAQVAQRLHSRDRLETERLAEILGSIEGATDQLTNVIQDLLDAANMRAGKPLSLRLEEVDLVALLAGRVAASMATSPAHEIRFTPEASSITGHWDHVRLQRVFDNLLANAVKFSPEHSTIEVRAGVEDGVAVATIADRGIGIAPHDLARVFDWFQRGSNVPAGIGGTGIGLAGAKQIVEQLGGTIEIESEEGQGSTFTVRLPVERQ